MRALLLALGLLTCSTFLACPKATCDVKSCPTGCCSSTGTCEGGTTNASCGSSAGVCQACLLGTSCTLGVCGGTSVGGGAGGGSGGGTSSGGGSGGSAALTQLCEDYANAYVGRYVRCGEITAAYGEIFKPYYAAQCASSFPPGFKDGRSELDQTAASTCLSAYATTNCLLQDSNCGQDLVRGLVPANGDCFDTSDCQDPFYCAADTTCPGRCVPRVAPGVAPTRNQECVKTAYVYNGLCTTFAALSQSCAPMGGSSETQSCAGPASCSTSQVCANEVPGPGLNQPCATTGPSCGHGLQCVNSVCMGRGDVGVACNDTLQCKGGLACTNSVCVASLPAASGQPCTPVTTTTNACLPGLFCEDNGSTKTCVPLRSVNGTCTNTQTQCAESLYCTATSTMPTGVCKAPGAVGAACVFGIPSYYQCANGYCTATATAMSGSCAALKGEGGSCQVSEECISSCNNNVCDRPSCFDPTP